MKQTAVSPQADGKRPMHWSIAAGWAFAMVLMAMLVLPAQNAAAQDNATITGVVTDASGALVPNANVTITNIANNQSRETVSNNAGSFRFANVGIGTDSDIEPNVQRQYTNAIFKGETRGFFPAVAAEMLSAGMTVEEVSKIGGGNFCRVFGKVTAAGRQS